MTSALEAGGCWHCGVNTPVVYLDVRQGVTWLPRGPGKEGVRAEAWSRPYALCLPCLALWFPGWPHDRAEAWLERERCRGERWELEKVLREHADKRDLAAWLAGIIK